MPSQQSKRSKQTEIIDQETEDTEAVKTAS